MLPALSKLGGWFLDITLTAIDWMIMWGGGRALSHHPHWDWMPVLKLHVIDRHGSCAKVVAAAQLEDVNMAGSRLPNMHGLFIRFLQGKGHLQHVRSKTKEDLTCDVKFSVMQNSAWPVVYATVQKPNASYIDLKITTPNDTTWHHTRDQLSETPTAAQPCSVLLHYCSNACLAILFGYVRKDMIPNDYRITKTG